MTTTFFGASLAFEAKKIRIVLEDILAQIEEVDAVEKGAGLSAPEIEVPALNDEDLPLDALGELALKEILAHARSGTAEVCLPLKPTTFRKGPFSFTLPDNARCIVELRIENGIIIREETKGRIEPALQLPLGVQLTGIYLDDEGSLFAALAGFPDLNLSWLALSGLKVPKTLREVLERAIGNEDTRIFKKKSDEESSVDDKMAEDHNENTSTLEQVSFNGEEVLVTDVQFSDEKNSSFNEETQKSDSKKSIDDGPIDLLRLSVCARDVLPLLTPLILGDAGVLIPGAKTRLDVDFTMHEIRICGEMELTGGKIEAGGFSVAGLVGTGMLDWHLKGVLNPIEMKLDFKCERGCFDNAILELKNGTHVELAQVSVEKARVQMLWQPTGVRFDISSGDATGHLTGGVLLFQLGGREVVAKLAPCSAQGWLKVSNQCFSVDIEVEEGEMNIEELYVPLGVAAFDLQRLRATGRGRLRAATDMGVAFSGLLFAEGEVFDGNIDLGPIRAHLVEGSEAQFSIRELAIGDKGVEALSAQGQLDVRLASGCLPLSESFGIGFSRGGMGRITFDEMQYFPIKSKWPQLRGHATMMARADPLDVESVLRIPAGSAHIQLGQFSLGKDGILELNDLRTWLRSDDESL